MERYEKYKDSGVEWIGEVPEHWEVKRLKFIGESIIGITYNPSEVSPVGEGFLVLRSSNIQNGALSFEDNVHVQKKVNEKHITKQGDILLCARNGSAHLVGKSAFITKQYEGLSFGAFMTVVRSNLEKYLYYFFNSEIFKAQTGLYTTSTINQLTSDTLDNMSVTFPKQIVERVTIANYLDPKTAEIDQLIADKKRLITLYEEEKTALINQAVTKGLDPKVKMKDSGIEWLGEVPEGWEVKKLKYVLQSIVGGGTPSTTNNMYWDGDIPWVSAKDMKQDLIFSAQDFITELAIKESSTSFIPDERVLIVVRSGILKHTLPVAINKVPVCINQDLKALKPISQISNDYFFWKLKGMSKDILTFCNKMGATVDSLELTDLMNFPFSFPDIREQHEIVNHIEIGLNLINDKLQKQQKLIDLLTEYRTALISEVVTGKVRVA